MIATYKRCPLQNSKKLYLIYVLFINPTSLAICYCVLQSSVRGFFFVVGKKQHHIIGVNEIVLDNKTCKYSDKLKIKHLKENCHI